MDNIALDLKFYRTKSAIQFTLIKPNRPEERSSRIKPGSLLIEIAKNLEGRERAYDWNNKITIALNIIELGKLGLALEGKKTADFRDDGEGDFVTLASFLHDPNIGSQNQGKEVKKLILSGKKGTDLVMIRLQTTLGNNKSVTFPLSAEERYVLVEIVKSAIPRALGW